MNPGFIVRLRPAGPWRIGPASGARNIVDHIYHSDSLYSAITSAIAQIDSLEEWIAATAGPGPGKVDVLPTAAPDAPPAAAPEEGMNPPELPAEVGPMSD